LAGGVRAVGDRIDRGVMSTGNPHISSFVRTTCRLMAVAAAVGAAVVSLSTCPPEAAAQTGVAPSYGWPVKPFDRQHPVRGWFGDPRILGKSHSFHFGVDVSCPNGTPVYATVSGHAYVYPKHPETVFVRADDGRRVFDYWHIRPRIRSGQRVRAYETVVGTAAAPWEHVHFAEHTNGVYVNPLRPGAMGPYSDRTAPALRSFTVESTGRILQNRVAYGRVDLVVEAYDETPISIEGPWHGKPLTPALLQWRMAGGGTLGGWHTSVDFRLTYPSNERWNETYAGSTRQNKKIWDARYRFYLVHDLNTRSLRDGRYEVEVKATDIRGNCATRKFMLTVANGA
jgi:hypothetical protein